MWSSIESQECDPQHRFEFEPTLILLYPHGLQEELGSIGVKKDVSWWRCGRSGRDPAGVSSHVREPFLDPLASLNPCSSRFHWIIFSQDDLSMDVAFSSGGFHQPDIVPPDPQLLKHVVFPFALMGRILIQSSTTMA